MSRSLKQLQMIRLANSILAVTLLYYLVLEKGLVILLWSLLHVAPQLFIMIMPLVENYLEPLKESPSTQMLIALTLSIISIGLCSIFKNLRGGYKIRWPIVKIEKKSELV